MAGIRARIEGGDTIRATQASFRRAPKVLDRLIKRFLRTAGGIARKGFREQFKTSGRTFNTPWAPLAKRTLRGRGRGRKRLPLFGTGKLFQSVTSPKFERRGKNNLEIVSHVRGKNKENLLILHEKGGGNLPKRRIRHPIHGITGAPLRQIESEWEGVAEELSRELGR